MRLANVPQDLSAANFPFVILGMFSYRSDGCIGEIKCAEDEVADRFSQPT